MRPVRRQLAFTAPLTPPAPRIPFTIDFASTAYFHNSDDGLLFGLADPDQADGFDTTWTPDWLDAVPRRRTAPGPGPGRHGDGRRLGRALRDHPGPQRPDRPCRRNSRNFLYATGFSGHGFLQAPAVGEIVRDLYLDRTPFIDVTPFSADRFTTGAPTRPEIHVV